MPPSILVLCGPTASGKSALAESLASRFGAFLVSADSRQVYRRMDIGTAKPMGPSRERWAMIDVADPGQVFSAGEYARQAAAVIGDAFEKRHPTIVAGGTGLYLRALLEGLAEIPPVPGHLRQGLEQELREFGLENLVVRLKEEDPEAAGKMDLKNPRRVLRALEVKAATGKALSWWHAQGGQPAVQARQLWLGIEATPKALERNIRARNQAAFQAGWVEEVRGLLKDFGAEALRLTPAIGYNEIAAHLEGQQSLEEAEAVVELRTRQYARRQMTWFKALPQVQWVRLEDPGAIAGKVEAFLKGKD